MFQFHLIFNLEGADQIFLASGLNIYFFNTSTGAILASTVDGCAVSIDRDSLPKGHIRAIAYHRKSKKIAFVSNDKELQVWDSATFKKLSSTKIFKRAMCIKFSTNGESLYIGDRTGDLYRLSIIDPALEPILLVGHVSILTDFFFSVDGKKLVTSDRDEKIRIHHYPQTYNIEHFCLQHKEYISKLFPIPGTDSFLSAGGDSFLAVWNIVSGQLEDVIPFPPPKIDVGDLKPDVACLEYHTPSKMIAIILQKFHGVLLYALKDSKTVEFNRLIVLPCEPLGLCFDLNGSLIITAIDSDQPLLIADSRADYSVTSGSPLINQILQITKKAPLTDTDRALIDIYEISKMRKWSQWQPIGKSTEKIDAKRQIEGGVDSFIEKKIKL